MQRTPGPGYRLLLCEQNRAEYFSVSCSLRGIARRKLVCADAAAGVAVRFLHLRLPSRAARRTLLSSMKNLVFSSSTLIGVYLLLWTVSATDTTVSSTWPDDSSSNALGDDSVKVPGQLLMQRVPVNGVHCLDGSQFEFFYRNCSANWDRKHGGMYPAH